MPTEEEIRRRCIIDPESCPGGPPPPAAVDPGDTSRRDAWAEELYLAYKSPHDQPWAHLSPDHQAPWKRQSEALLAVWEPHLIGVERHVHKAKAGKAKAGAEE